jgi:hypothetical protein
VYWRLRHRDQLEEACRLFEQAIDRQKAAHQGESGPHPYRRRLADHYRNLARTAVRLGEHARAAAAAEELVRHSPDGAADSYNGARFLACCAALAEREPRAGPQAQNYAERAVQLLWEAMKRGYKVGNDLNDDADFAALRRRDDFKNVVAELKAANQRHDLKDP